MGALARRIGTPQNPLKVQVKRILKEKQKRLKKKKNPYCKKKELPLGIIVDRQA
jgi:hypothetical protein